MTDDRRDTLFRQVTNAFDADHYAYGLELSRQLSREHPDFIYGWAYQGIFLSCLARPDEAERILLYAISRSDSDRFLNVCYTRLGHLYTEARNFELAEKNYRRAIELAPDDAGGYVYLGIMFLRMGNHKLAESIYWRGTRCSQGAPDEAFVNLGLLLRSADRLEEALTCAEQALTVDPDYAEAGELKEDLELAIRRRAEV